MPAPEPPHRPTRAGLITFGIVLLGGFFFVDSEWRGGGLQALGGAVLLAVPAALVVWGILAAPASSRAAGVLRLLLLLAVLLSLAGIYSYGMFTTPLLLAPLWIATWRGGLKEGLLWTVLAAPCWIVTGWLLSSSFDPPIRDLPTVLTIGGVILFLLTSWSSPPRVRDAADGVSRPHG